MKNVAGFDLTKLFIGSYGTLGLITDVTLKIVGKPRAQRTLFMPVDDLRYGLLWARQLLPMSLVASAIVVCDGEIFSQDDREGGGPHGDRLTPSKRGHQNRAAAEALLLIVEGS